MRVHEPVCERTMKVTHVRAREAMYCVSEEVVRLFADSANDRKATLISWSGRSKPK
jgi:hypothetical protein